MLQHPLDTSNYSCSVQESLEGDYSTCTVVIRKKEISDDIIEKQGFLIQKMKQDNIFIKRLLQTKSVEIQKMRGSIERLQEEKNNLSDEISIYKSHYKNNQYLAAMNQKLANENSELLQKLEVQKAEIQMVYRMKIQELESRIQGLKKENDFLTEMGSYQQKGPNKALLKLQKQNKELQQSLQTERKINESLMKDIQMKFNYNEPIKIIDEPVYPYQFMKGSFDMDHPIKRTPKEQFEISLVKSKEDSQMLFQDSEFSYEENEDPKSKSMTYQKSEAEIQTERCQFYETAILTRQKIDQSFKHRRNNHHMKPVDEQTRIMYLSKELNQKDKTIKELQKKFEKQKKNSESVKSKLKIQEKELKHLKKQKSLKRQILIEDDANKVKNEEVAPFIVASQQKIESRESEKLFKEQPQALLSLRQQNVELQELLKRKQMQTVNLEKLNDGLKQEIQQLKKDENIVQIKQEVDYNEVIMQTDRTSEIKDEILSKLEEQNFRLKKEIQQLKQKIGEQILVQPDNVEVQEYPQTEFNIRISKKHDEDSYCEPVDELTRLRQENQTLKNKLQYYIDNEPIPLNQSQESVIRLKEVVTQTRELELQAGQDQWERISRKIQAEHQGKNVKENQSYGADLFSRLLYGLTDQIPVSQVQTNNQIVKIVDNKEEENSENKQKQIIEATKIEVQQKKIETDEKAQQGIEKVEEASNQQPLTNIVEVQQTQQATQNQKVQENANNQIPFTENIPYQTKAEQISLLNQGQYLIISQQPQKENQEHQEQEAIITINALPESQSFQQQLQKLETENQDLRATVNELKRLYADARQKLQSKGIHPQKGGKIESSANIENEAKEKVKINVIEMHDEDSQVEGNEETAHLRQQVEELKEKLQELGEGEIIPFLDYTEENRMNEVNLQTDVRQSEIQQKANEEKVRELEAMLERLESENQRLRELQTTVQRLEAQNKSLRSYEQMVKVVQQQQSQNKPQQQIKLNEQISEQVQKQQKPEEIATEQQSNTAQNTQEIVNNEEVQVQHKSTISRTESNVIVPQRQKQDEVNDQHLKEAAIVSEEVDKIEQIEQIQLNEVIVQTDPQQPTENFAKIQQQQKESNDVKIEEPQPTEGLIQGTVANQVVEPQVKIGGQSEKIQTKVLQQQINKEAQNVSEEINQKDQQQEQQLIKSQIVQNSKKIGEKIQEQLIDQIKKKEEVNVFEQVVENLEQLTERVAVNTAFEQVQQPICIKTPLEQKQNQKQAESVSLRQVIVQTQQQKHQIPNEENEEIVINQELRQVNVQTDEQPKIEQQGECDLLQSRQMKEVVVQTQAVQSQIQKKENDIQQINVNQKGELDLAQKESVSLNKQVQIKQQQNIQLLINNQSNDPSYNKDNIHILQNQLNSDHFGQNYEQILRDKISINDNSNQQNNQYIITNNERTLLYTLQQEANQWKAKYYELLKEKNLIEEALNKQKSMYISYELHPKCIKFQPQVQLSLDGSNVPQHVDEQSKRKSGSNELIKEQIIEQNQQNPIEPKEVIQQNQQNVESIKIQAKQIKEENIKIQDFSPKQETKNEVVEQKVINNDQVVQKQIQQVNENGSKDQNEMVVDKTISQKQGQVNNENLTDLITEVIEQQNKTQNMVVSHNHIIEQKDVKQENQETAKAENSEIMIQAKELPQSFGQNEQQIQIRVTQKLNDSSIVLPEGEVMQLKNEVDKLKEQLKQVREDTPIPLHQQIQLKEVVLQTDKIEQNCASLEETIRTLKEEVNKIESEKQFIRKKLQKYQGVSQIHYIDLNNNGGQGGQTIDRQIINSNKQKSEEDQFVQIRISHKHDEQSYCQPSDQLTLLREQNSRLKQQLQQYHENEPIPLHEIEEQIISLNQVATQIEQPQKIQPKKNYQQEEQEQKHEQQKIIQEDKKIYDQIQKQIIQKEIQQIKQKKQQSNEEVQKEEKNIEKVEEVSSQKSLSVAMEVKQKRIETDEKAQQGIEKVEEASNQQPLTNIVEVQQTQQATQNQKVQENGSNQTPITENIPKQTITEQVSPLNQGQIQIISQQPQNENQQNQEQEAIITINALPQGQSLQQQLQKLETENQDLRATVNELKRLYADARKKLQSKGIHLQKGGKIESSANIENEAKEKVKINVIEMHDEDSQVEGNEETAHLRQQVEQLKEKLQELGEGEIIPFLDYTEENRMNEVNLQTDVRQSEIQQKANEEKVRELEAMLQRIENENQRLRELQTTVQRLEAQNKSLRSYEQMVKVVQQQQSQNKPQQQIKLNEQISEQVQKPSEIATEQQSNTAQNTQEIVNNNEVQVQHKSAISRTESKVIVPQRQKQGQVNDQHLKEDAIVSEEVDKIEQIEQIQLNEVIVQTDPQQPTENFVGVQYLQKESIDAKKVEPQPTEVLIYEKVTKQVIEPQVKIEGQSKSVQQTKTPKQQLNQQAQNVIYQSNEQIQKQNQALIKVEIVQNSQNLIEGISQKISLQQKKIEQKIVEQQISKNSQIMTNKISQKIAKEEKKNQEVVIVSEVAENVEKISEKILQNKQIIQQDLNLQAKSNTNLELDREIIKQKQAQKIINKQNQIIIPESQRVQIAQNQIKSQLGQLKEFKPNVQNIQETNLLQDSNEFLSKQMPIQGQLLSITQKSKDQSKELQQLSKQLLNLKDQNKYLHELVAMLKSDSIKISSPPTFSIQQPTQSIQSNNDNNQNNEEVLRSLQIEKIEVQPQNREVKVIDNDVKEEISSVQTPKFQQSAKRLFASLEKELLIKEGQPIQQQLSRITEELALKNEQLSTLTTRMDWLQGKLKKYKKIANKCKKQHRDLLKAQESDEPQQMEIEEQEIELNEVQTQTNPYMFNQQGEQGGIEKYTEQLQFKLQQELKINHDLRGKIKRWQNVLRKIHGSNALLGDEMDEDMQELEIEEQNVQLCQVEVQVSSINTDYERKDKEEIAAGRGKIKQLFLSQIQNLKQRWIGEDSQEIESQNCSDRGKNTKRSVGSDEQEKAKRSHEKLLQMELCHVYKDIQTIFKKYQYNAPEDLNIDNFKDYIEEFVAYIKRETFHHGIKYNSFEDIKEQENDDSIIEKKKTPQKGGSETLVEGKESSKNLSPSQNRLKENSIQNMSILFIEQESVISQKQPILELNPLVITEVHYQPISKVDHNDLLLKLMQMSGIELARTIDLLVSEFYILKEQVKMQEPLDRDTLQQFISLCGQDNLVRMLGCD